MKEKNNKARRRFLKNISFLGLGVGLAPLSKGSVEEVDSNKAAINCDSTTADYYGEGPFYTANPPSITNNKLTATGEPGTPIIITGRVYNLDCTEYIPNAVIDVWHANDAGQYDNTGYNLRGKTVTNSQGFYSFETIQPGKYLNGSSYRPSHIHFKITPPGFPTVTTQLYFEGDTSIAGDAAASITSGTYDASSRIIALSPNAQGILEGTWDIVVSGEGVLGLHDLHLDKGMIYSANPNPFTSEVTIKYGVFNSAKIALSVHDSVGQLVATLNEEVLESEKYEAVWKPELEIASGTYFLTLKVNDIQVHYLKIIKQ